MPKLKITYVVVSMAVGFIAAYFFLIPQSELPKTQLSSLTDTTIQVHSADGQKQLLGQTNSVEILGAKPIGPKIGDKGTGLQGAHMSIESIIGDSNITISK